MCGICGIVEKNKDKKKLVTEMCNLLAHRGPDNSAIYQSGDFCLGHRRLSIIDLTTGDQPIFNYNKSLAIIFNGEIYNYRELRTELIHRGITFNTNSDTEVILKLYENDGTDSFKRLNGIFAFAILDERQSSSKLILVRDFFGIKPLHFYAKNGIFLFASEYKAILIHPSVQRKLNPQALHHQVNLRYNQTDQTLIEDILRLPPAHYLLYENGSIKKIERYYQIIPKIDNVKSEAEWLEEIPFFLRQAVKRQQVSDVPIGVYLSGGMDSSSIVAMMRGCGIDRIKTFTLGFNEPTDELEDARIIAEYYETEHQEHLLDLNPMRRLPEVVWHAEEPKINLLQGFAMSDFVSKHVKVVLGGLGGDELFSGYDIHKFILPFNTINRLVSQGIEAQLLAKISTMLHTIQSCLFPKRFDEYRRGIQMILATGNIKKMYLILRNVWDFDGAQLKNIYSPKFIEHNLQPVERDFEPLFEKYGGQTALDQVYLAEIQSKMVNDYLLVEDRMSMSHSLEERVPFLDIDLVNLGLSIPAKMKMLKGQTKGLLRKAMAPYLPKSIIQKKKWGFTFNPYLQFQKDLKSTAEQVLTKERIDKDGIFNYHYIRSILQAPPHPRMRWHYNFIWILLGFYVWKEMFLHSRDFKIRYIQDII